MPRPNPALGRPRLSFEENLTHALQLGIKVDPCDLHLLGIGKYWIANGYATVWLDNKDTRLHHLIMPNCPDGYIVDHKDQNRLNNRRGNLRYVTPAVNTLNSTRIINRKPKGYSYCKRAENYKICFTVLGHFFYFGRCATEEEASLKAGCITEAINHYLRVTEHPSAQALGKILGVKPTRRNQ